MLIAQGNKGRIGLNKELTCSEKRWWVLCLVARVYLTGRRENSSPVVGIPFSLLVRLRSKRG